MALVKLRDVARLAYSDLNFFKALQKDPVKALNYAKVELSATDLQTLQKFLATDLQQVEVNVPKLIAWAHAEVMKAGIPTNFGDPWDVDWGKQWVTFSSPKPPPEK